MEPKASSQKAGISSSDFASDPEEKEFSEGEDEDDDRNHKHRRRDGHSQSLEGDSVDHGLTRMYRKRNRPFENRYSYREGDSQSDFSRFEKRRTNQASFSRGPLELNQRIRGNQMILGDLGYARGRGREAISWGRRDPRLGLVDVAPQIVQPGPVHSALFPGMDLPNVSNAQSTSWNGFGLVPGIPNGGLDPLHPIGLQGALRPVISPSMNIGIPRQRCRDFEERGFCLRGDMCPMEHGVNRIVIEDVQGLSQFNLPVSQFLGTSSGQGALPAISTASGSLINSKAYHSQNSNPGVTEDGFGLNVGIVGGSMAGMSDLYDPDQPLWANDNPGTSAALLGLNQSNHAEAQSFLDKDFSDRQYSELYEGYNEELSIRNSTGRSQNSSVWGRIGKSKRSSVVKGKSDCVETSYLEHEIKSEEAVNTALPNNSPHQVKWTHVDGNAPLIKESSSKLQGVSIRNIRKASQKALRTLFVNGVPLKDNKREALLSHFQKFGEVVDIYIPMHSERAFIQFSKREEAEAALRAPDAVMGNRFIKLWWANRDNVPDGGNIGTSSVPVTSHGMTHNSALSHQFVHDKGKENPQPAGGKDGNAQPSLSQQTYDHPKPMVTPSPKAPQLPQKKLESLELLKEELRKKQEMLDQKRNEFKRQLDKLAKQAVGKDATLSEFATSQNGEILDAKAETSNLSPRDTSVTTEKATSAEHTVSHTSTSSLNEPLQEPMKPSFCPLAPPGAAPFVVNRYKLDNRSTTFRVVPPLPADFANVAALKEHFSAYGDLSSVELEESEVQKSNDASVLSEISARVSFTARRFAEKAFLHGKCWQGHKLQLKWITSTTPHKEGTSSGDLSASSNVPSANAQQSREDASTHSEKVTASIIEEPEQPAREAANAVDCSEHDNKDSNSGTGEPEQLAREAATATVVDSAEQDEKDSSCGAEQAASKADGKQLP